MNLTITLRDSDARVLEMKAKAQRISAEQYALRVREKELAPDWLRNSWACAEDAGLDHLTMDEIDAEISAARRR